MPIEKMRLLSLLILAASIISLISGDFGVPQFVTYLAMILPIWFDIDLDKIRKMFFWKIYIWVTFILLFIAIGLKINLKLGIFFLILFCLIYEFYGEQRPKAPLRLISLLSFLIVIYQARLYIGSKLLLTIFLYTLSIALCLMGFYLLRLNYKNKRDQFKWTPISALLHIVPILAVSLPIYWLVPRIPRQSLRMQISEVGESISGFSDRVTLTDIGVLKRSRKHVMDLTIESGRLRSQHLKGRSFRHYDRGAWEPGGFSTFKRGDRVEFASASSYKETYSYRIDLDPFLGNTLFFFEDLIRFRNIDKYLKVTMSKDHISLMNTYPTSITYYGISGYQSNKKEKLTNRNPYLQIPDNHQYIFDYASEVVPNPESMTHKEIADTLVYHFLANFEYTLDINNYNVEDPLHEFLIIRQEGHCELFASSMVLLLRSMGIPTRLVTGFLLPEIHPSGDFYNVSESDAHAWVEVFIDGQWRTYDPTPPATFVEPNYVQNQIVSFNYFLKTMILSWDYDSQRDAVEAISKKIDLLKSLLAENPWYLLVFLVPIGVTVGIYLNRERLKTPHDRLQIHFQKLERSLADQYRPREPSETFQDYIQRLSLPAKLEIDLNRFSDRYYHLRYGREFQMTSVKKLIQDARMLRGRIVSG